MTQKATVQTTVQDNSTPKPEIDPFQVDITLPSKGMFYGDALPSGKVTIRPIKVKEEKLLAGGGNRLHLADLILERCIVSKCPPVKDLLITDKFYMLLCLRSISYGADYTFEIKCTQCSLEFKKTVQLPEGLQIRSATQEDKEPFDIDLPSCKKKVTLRFLRGVDEEEIENYVKQSVNVGTSEGDPSYAFRLARYIVTVDGKEMPILEKLSFCENLVGKDSLAIRQAIAEKETGPIFTITAKCPSCQNEMSTLLPLTNEFFRVRTS